MPVQECQRDGLPGYRWGEQGKCYTYDPDDQVAEAEAKKQAIAQGVAIGEMADSTSGDMTLLDLVLFADLDDDRKAKLKERGEWWINLLRVGDFFPLAASSGRKVAKITEALLGEIEKNTRRVMEMLGGSLPIDANHATAHWSAGMTYDGGDTKRRARMTDFRVKDGVLQALFAPTPLGMEEILDQGAWEGISAEVDDLQDKQTKEHIGPAVMAATVTNRPYINGLGGLLPVTLSELARARSEIGSPSVSPAVEQEDPDMDLIKRLSEVHGEALTEDKIVELFGEMPTLREGASKLEKLEATNAELSQKLGTLEEAKGAADGQVATYAEQLSTVQSELKTLSGQFAESQKQLSGEREERIIGRDLGRCAVSKAEAGTADEPGVARKIYRADAALYAESYGERADNAVATGKPTGHSEEPKPKGDDTAGITSQMDAEAFLTGRAALYMEQNDGVDYGEALVRVKSELGDEGTRLHNLMREA